MLIGLVNSASSNFKGTMNKVATDTVQGKTQKLVLLLLGIMRKKFQTELTGWGL